MSRVPDWAWLIVLVVSNSGAYRRGRRSAQRDGAGHAFEPGQNPLFCGACEMAMALHIDGGES